MVFFLCEMIMGLEVRLGHCLKWTAIIGLYLVWHCRISAHFALYVSNVLQRDLTMNLLKAA